MTLRGLSAVMGGWLAHAVRKRKHRPASDAEVGFFMLCSLCPYRVELTDLRQAMRPYKLPLNGAIEACQSFEVQ